MPLHRKHADWLLGRGIDPTLAEEYGLETTMRADGKAWLSVPYREGAEVINHKYRLISEKGHGMDKGAPLALWNADCLSDPKVRGGLAPLVITEGEWDALSAIQAGFQFAVSVPNGAPGKPTTDLETAPRYNWVDRHAEALAGVKEFVIAADADEAGYHLAADLVALLGADRCRFVEYPFPAKDLNEVLQEFGPERVVDCITTARPYPVQGLYCVDDFPERGEVRSYPVGIPAIADMIRIVPGTLTVVTGYANMGKSTMMNSIMAAALEEFPVCIASFETDVKPILVNGLRMAMLRCGKAELAKRDTSEVDRVIRSKLSVISQSVDEDMEMDIDKFLELARLAVIRHGAKMIVLDPWNEVEHKRRRDETETDYIGRAIRAIKRFAKQHDVAFWVVAHPTKPQEASRNRIPGLYDISGSANWANKADYGLTYHRAKFDVNEADIVITKVRMGLPGKRGTAKVAFDFRTSEFVQFAP